MLHRDDRPWRREHHQHGEFVSDAPTDDAAEKLKQAEAVRLKAVKVLVGVDECCDECQDASELENERGGE